MIEQEPPQGILPQSASAAAQANRARARRDALGVSAVTLLIVGAGILGLWTSSTRAIRDNYRQYLIGLAQTAASMVDPPLHNSIRRPEQRNGTDYERAVLPLRRMRAAVQDVHYIYTVVRDGAAVRFVLDASDPVAPRTAGIDDQSGVWELYTERDAAMLRALGAGDRAGEATATEQPLSDKWGQFMTGWAPLRDAAGRQIGAVGVDVDARVYVARIAAAPKWALIGLSPAVLMIALLGVVFYRVRLRSLDGEEAVKASVAVLAQERRALSESEAKFRSLFELSPVGFALIDLKSRRFLQINDALLARSGYSREEYLQLSFTDIDSVPDPTGNAAPLETLAGADGHGLSEREFLRKDGSAYPVLLSAIRMRDVAGREVIWSIVQDISERKAMESELADAARRDKLTGLANRAGFIEHLQQAMDRVHAGEQALFGVMFLDFDRFKLVNDTLGHKAGDELLCQIAVRLRASLRAADSLVGRFGGDEFLVLVNDLKCPADANLVAERLLSALAPLYDILGSEVQSTASIGIVIGDGRQSCVEDVMRNADVAMYEAKRSGGGCSVVFDEAMHTRLMRHVAVETQLRKAIGGREICLVFQPIVDLNSGSMVSAEALVRWNHPLLGAISPSEFIPIAEESRLIIDVGQWVLTEACQALAAWRRSDPLRAPKTVSVNVSRAELALGSRLLEQLRRTLERVGLPPGCLQLEVTEREVMRNPESSLELMRQLRQLGVRLAMDDFGTGNSSLGLLREYPFDTIKIDRSFVKDLMLSQEVLAVTHATINLIDNLGMASLAEGVEEAAQVAVLQSMGCRYAQGYHFSHPVPAAQLLDALQALRKPVAA